MSGHATVSLRRSPHISCAVLGRDRGFGWRRRVTFSWYVAQSKNVGLGSAARIRQSDSNHAEHDVSGRLALATRRRSLPASAPGST